MKRVTVDLAVYTVSFLVFDVVKHLRLRDVETID